MPCLTKLDTYDPETGSLNTIIETPKGSRNKYKYDDDRRLFVLHSVLSSGLVFPFDFGFIPSTLGEDGDPLDVLLLMDESASVGCLTPARLLGVIEAEQTEDGETCRNDRLIAVNIHSHTHKAVRTLDALSRELLEEIEHFFISYTCMKDKEFKP
jgi:inorganic pyrophosphatase